MDQTAFRLRGYFTVECFDQATGEVLWCEKVRNAATLAGLTALLQDFFAAGTQKTQWFVGLIDNTGYTGVDEDDTMSSHPGWSEATGYSSATRPQWTPLAVASGIITNSTQVVYTATTTLSLKGLLIVSNSTKGGTTGTLWATAIFGSVRAMVAGNGLRLTYTVIGTGGNA